MRTTDVAALVEESHFSIRVTACACGQEFAVVFTERIDWREGNDDQTWVSLPLTVGESAALRADAAGAEGALRSLALAVIGRRFLVRAWTEGPSPTAWWRTSGFGIGPHD